MYGSNLLEMTVSNRPQESASAVRKEIDEELIEKKLKYPVNNFYKHIRAFTIPLTS